MLKGCALHCTDRAPLDPGVSFARLPMVRVRADAYGDWYEAELRTELKRVGYCFELEAEDGIWYYYGDCFERQLPRQRYECFQFPYDHRADRLEVPAWAADAIPGCACAKTACSWRAFSSPPRRARRSWW